MNRVSISTLIIGGLVVCILLTYAFTYQVAFHEVAIKVRLGRADQDSVMRTPGLKFRLPWPVEAIQTYDIRLRTMDTPETEVKTFDGKNVIIGAYAIWQIENPLQFFKRVRTVAEAERQMRSRIGQVQAAVIGQSNLSDFVNLDAAQVDANFDRILTTMRDGVAPKLLEDYGVAVQEIGIRRISLPKETTQQVFASMTQERNKQATTYREEGKAEAAAIVARAAQEANQILSFAERKAEEIRSAGTQAATRIYARIQDEDREFFEWLRWLDALRAALSQQTTIFLDEKSPFFAPFVNPPVSYESAGQ